MVLLIFLIFLNVGNNFRSTNGDVIQAMDAYAQNLLNKGDRRKINDSVGKA